MHDYLSDSIYRWLILSCWVHIASIEIYAVCIDSIMPSSNPIRIENRKNIKHKMISQNIRLFCCFSQIFEDPSHNM